MANFLPSWALPGSGKSTLMNICGCLDRPTSGQYLFEGVDLARLSEPALAHIRERSHRLRVSELQPAGAHQCHRECGSAAVLFRSWTRAPCRTRGRAPARALEALGLAAATPTTRVNSRAASNSASPSHGRSSISPACCWQTSRPAILIRAPRTRSCETLRRLNREQDVTIVVVTHERDIAAMRTA